MQMPEDFIKTNALDLGFEVCRIARADAPWEAGGRLATFLEAGHHGTMGWMAETAARRGHPTTLWPEAKSAVMVGLNYGPQQDPLALLKLRECGAISVYAQGKDYHDVVKKRLKHLARAFVAHTGAAVKVFVDTAPLMEKPLAQRAGLGWQGKHTNLVSRQLGSWLFLGAMLTDHPLSPDDETDDHCGSCRACLDICPTDAFPAPYQLDARRCISYLTIEHKGPIPLEFRRAIGNRIYGCDDCLAICPWNKFAEISQEAAFFARIELRAPRLAELASLNDIEFREIFSGSPIKRIGRDRFVRNVLIALGNSGATTSLAPVLARLADASALVRGAAIWALRYLDYNRFLSERPRRLAQEIDPSVRQEWNGESEEV